MRPSATELLRLYDAINSLITLPEKLGRSCIPLLSVRNYKKNEHLLHAGDVAEYAYFILDGIVRLYYTREDGREYVRSFGVENDMCGAFYSSLTQTPCRFGIEALTQTRVIQAKFSDIRGLFETDIYWERLGRVLAEQNFISKEKREAELLLDDAETRYQHFLEEYPDLEARIAQYHIASYIGVTPVSLSRIRTKKKKD